MRFGTCAAPFVVLKSRRVACAENWRADVKSQISTFRAKLFVTSVLSLQLVPPTSSVSTDRPLSGCTGRLLPWKSAVKAPICAFDNAIGVVITNHFTPSLHGGVVSEPS